MYMEDLDLSYALAQAGWGTWYEPGATVMHVKAARAGGSGRCASTAPSIEGCVASIASTTPRAATSPLNGDRLRGDRGEARDGCRSLAPAA